MQTIEIKNRYINKTIFSHTCENNTIKITVEQAIKQNVDLQSADLQSADLQSADLQSANLYNANLQSANLYNADLQSANLYNADLQSANLYNADLRAYGNMQELKTIQLDTWAIGFTKDTLQIGCQRHLILEWRSFTDAQIERMDAKALVWWKKWKDIIFLIIDTAQQA